MNSPRSGQVSLPLLLQSLESRVSFRETRLFEEFSSVTNTRPSNCTASKRPLKISAHRKSSVQTSECPSSGLFGYNQILQSKLGLEQNNFAGLNCTVRASAFFKHLCQCQYLIASKNNASSHAHVPSNHVSFKNLAPRDLRPSLT